MLNAAGKQHIRWGAVDEEAYEKLATEISRHGSFLDFPGYYLSGQFRETFRGPAYVWLLSPLYDGRHFHRGLARTINAFLGASGAALIFLIVCRFQDYRTGLVAGLITAVSGCTTQYGGIVAVEPLLLLTSTVAWLCCLKAFERPRLNGPALVLAFGISAIAYYFKAQSLFFIPACLLTGLVYEKSGFLRHKSVWVACMVAVMLLSMNVIRNVNAFSRPFYNEATMELWLDAATESDEVGWQRKYGGPVQYFSRHTVGDFAERLLNGFVLQIDVIANELLAPAHISGLLCGISGIIGALLLFAFCAGFAQEENQRLLFLHGVVILMYVCMFSVRSGGMLLMYGRWYLPLMGVFAWYSARGLFLLRDGIGHVLPADRTRVSAIIGVILAGCCALITSYKIVAEAGMAVWIVPD